MASKIFTTDLKVGMFVADLDRPWVDTPFLLQGFLIENDEQIAALKTHCDYVIVDRARSTGSEFEAVQGLNVASPARKPMATPPRPGQSLDPDAATPLSAPVEPAKKEERRKGLARDRAREGAPPEASAARAGAPQDPNRTYDVTPADAAAAEPGFFGRLFSRFKGGKKAPGAQAPPPVEVPRETPQEFAARAELLPPGIEVQTYFDQVTVEEETPRAQAAVSKASDLLEKLVQDIRLGQSFEVERIGEIVEGMVESIVRNPDAAMWVARLREEDISTYGHGLQVSVYLTAFGRHLGFPKGQLEQLAQIGLLLDIGKIKLPRYLLEKQGRLTTEEYEVAKTHVQRGIEILTETPNVDPEVLEGIEQHHERMNGSGYPTALEGNEKFVSSIGVFPVGSLIELSTGEVAIVVAHNKVRRLKPRVLVVTGPDKTRSPHPAMLDLLYDTKAGGDDPVFIKRGLPAGAYDLDLKDFYLS